MGCQGCSLKEEQSAEVVWQVGARASGVRRAGRGQMEDAI